MVVKRKTKKKKGGGRGKPKMTVSSRVVLV